MAISGSLPGKIRYTLGLTVKMEINGGASAVM